MDARPHGLGLMFIAICAAAATGAALILLGMSGYILVGVVVFPGGAEDVAVAAAITVGGMMALVGCVQAALAFVLWGKVIGPRRDSHA